MKWFKWLLGAKKEQSTASENVLKNVLTKNGVQSLPEGLKPAEAIAFLYDRIWDPSFRMSVGLVTEWLTAHEAGISERPDAAQLSGKAAYIQGHIWSLNHMRENARPHYIKALARHDHAPFLEPKHLRSAISGLAKGYYEDGEFDEALLWYDRLLRRAAEDEGILDQDQTWGVQLERGQCLLELNRPSEALELAETILTEAEPVYGAEGYEMLTPVRISERAYLMLGQFDAAMRCADREFRIRQQEQGVIDAFYVLVRQVELSAEYGKKEQGKLCWHKLLSFMEEHSTHREYGRLNEVVTQLHLSHGRWR